MMVVVDGAVDEVLTILQVAFGMGINKPDGISSHCENHLTSLNCFTCITYSVHSFFIFKKGPSIHFHP